MSDAAESALNLLLTDYRQAHDWYVRRRREVFTWKLIAAGIAVTCVTAAVLFAFDIGSADGRVEMLTFAALCGAVTVGRVSFLTLATRSSRRQLQVLKGRLDYVGYYVACNQRPHPLADALLLRPDKPSGKHVVTFEGSDIDFDLYDRAFL